MFREIENSPALRWFGGLLSFSFVLSLLIYSEDRVLGVLSRSDLVVCWPLLPYCESWRIFSYNFWFGILALQGALSLFALERFWRAKEGGNGVKAVRTGCWLLLAAALVKTLVQLQDYRLLSNYHFMHLLVSFAYLLLPGKKSGLQLLIVSFYFFAGWLKLNREWLSGSALWQPIVAIPETIMLLGTVGIVILEFVLVWGVLYASEARRWTTWTLLVLFHLVSFVWVGFMYPSLMLIIITLFPLIWQLEPNERFSWRKMSPIFSLALVVLTAGHVISHFPGSDSALFTRNRIFALNMIDARTQCVAMVQIRRPGGVTFLDIAGNDFAVRTACDPIMYEGFLKRLCKEQALIAGETVVIEYHLLAKRKSDLSFLQIASHPHVCSALSQRRWFDWVLGRWPT